MYVAKLVATIKYKNTDKIVWEYDVMEIKYSIKDDMFWIIDHKGSYNDFDLNEFDIEVSMKNN